MRIDFVSRPLVLAALTAGLVACDNSLTQPSGAEPGTPAADRSPARPQPTRPVRPDTAKRHPCRGDNELTEEQIAAIRALSNAYQEEIADDLRLIAHVEEQAREAAAAGASRDRIAAILAQADEAKRNVAEATQRLRDAITDILHDDRVPCFVVIGGATSR